MLSFLIQLLFSPTNRYFYCSFKNDEHEKSKMSFSESTKGDTWNYAITIWLKAAYWTQLLMLMNMANHIAWRNVNGTRKISLKKSMLLFRFYFLKATKSGHGLWIDSISIASKRNECGSVTRCMLLNNQVVTFTHPQVWDVDIFLVDRAKNEQERIYADCNNLWKPWKTTNPEIFNESVVDTCLSLKVFISWQKFERSVKSYQKSAMLKTIWRERKFKNPWSGKFVTRYPNLIFLF